MISIIIVTYNSKNTISQCLDSIIKETIDKEIIVIDNSSIDDSVHLIEQKLKGIPKSNLLINKKNIGFAAAVNQGAKIARGDYLLILNPDTILKEGALIEMKMLLDKYKQVGIVGPLLEDENGNISFSTGVKWGMIYLIFRHVLPARMSNYISMKKTLKLAEKNHPSLVSWVLGACFMIKKKLWNELGGLDERFFLSADDTADLCDRAFALGIRTFFNPNARVVHIGGVSYKDKLSTFAQINVFKGHLLYINKKNKFYSTILRIIFIFISFIKAIVSSIFGLSNKKYKKLAKVHFISLLWLLKWQND